MFIGTAVSALLEIGRSLHLQPLEYHSYDEFPESGRQHQDSDMLRQQ
jgi:hypothetical protein